LSKCRKIDGRLQLTGVILQHAKATKEQFCLLFPTHAVAQACVDFVTANPRTDEMDTVPRDIISIRAFDSKEMRVFGVFFPVESARFVMPFWMNAGLGISSRFAEEMLQQVTTLEEIAPPMLESTDVNPTGSGHHVQQGLCERIRDLLERSPVGPRAKKISPGDVYLYQTGMSAIYYVHNLLIKWRNNKKAKTVMFGFPFHQTIHIFEFWGPGVEFFPLGTELEQLELYIKSEAESGSPVQAVWTEFPSNPLLVSSDLDRLRQLADEYKFALVVDDTVGSFCNVDVLGIADIVVTSLTKSFSGYADVMGGSAVLNPNTSLYAELEPHFRTEYHNDLYLADAEVLLNNSGDYLARSKVLNANAEGLVNYLESLVADPNSSVTHVYYPTVSPTLETYNKFKRPATSSFTPGYGCLFSVELKTVECTIAFYNNLHVHHGPHLGAHRTLALPYVKALYIDELDKVKPMGLNEAQIRVSVGLEDIEVLVETFKHALRFADAISGAAGK
jgi:cystathionine gamma-synthase